METSTKTMTLAFKTSQHEIIHPTRTKFLIGSDNTCDLTLTDETISEIHAMILMTELGMEVIDLQSANGIFINGQRVLKGTLQEGDALTIGSLHLGIVDIPEGYEIVCHDQKVKSLERDNSDKIFVPQTENENAVLIDEEYCDIVFDENNFHVLKDSPLKQELLLTQDYVELDTSDKEFEIFTEKDERAILVTTLSSGVVINQRYFNLNQKTIFATGNAKRKNDLYIDLLDINQRVPFIKIEGEEISCQKLNQIELITTPFLSGENVVILSYKTYQIMVELSSAPNEVKNIPFWKRETSFYKESAKIFMAVMLPMLLLLLVNFELPKEEDKKEIAIIYKKAKPVDGEGKVFATSEPNSKTENTGHKKEVQQEKLTDAKKGAKKPTPKKPVKKVVKSQKQPAKGKNVKAPVKAYEFKMKNNINNLFSQTSVAGAKSKRADSSVNVNAASESGPIDTRVSASGGSEVGKLGLDNSGGANATGGVRGLSSKKGLETSFIEPRTVVLGSMDPELLRKILQEYLPQFRHCYQQELAYNSEDIQGIVDLNFEISPNGKVSKIDIKAKDSRFSKKGVDCMGKVLSIINFPKPKGGGRVAVRQPLSFFSEKERG